MNKCNHDHGGHNHGHSGHGHHDDHEGHSHFSKKMLTFVVGFTVVGTSIGELLSLSDARQRGAEKAVTSAVQSAVDNGDCGLSMVLGRTMPYDSKSDTLGLFRKAGTVTVGQELEGFVKNGDGTLTYRVQLRDNVSGHSSTDRSLLSGDADNSFGTITVASRSCTNHRLLAELNH